LGGQSRCAAQPASMELQERKAKRILESQYG
jgi:hypothetical protein